MLMELAQDLVLNPGLQICLVMGQVSDFRNELVECFWDPRMVDLNLPGSGSNSVTVLCAGGITVAALLSLTYTAGTGAPVDDFSSTSGERKVFDTQQSQALFWTRTTISRAQPFWCSGLEKPRSKNELNGTTPFVADAKGPLHSQDFFLNHGSFFLLSSLGFQSEDF